MSLPITNFDHINWQNATYLRKYRDRNSRVNVDIFYMDALPGVGKTWWAINKILAMTLDSEGNVRDQPTTTVYVSPTVALLQEVHNSLKPHGYLDVHLVHTDNKIDPEASILAEVIPLLRRRPESRQSMHRVVLITQTTFVSLKQGMLRDKSDTDHIVVIFDETIKLIREQKKWKISSRKELQFLNNLIEVSKSNYLEEAKEKGIDVTEQFRDNGRQYQRIYLRTRKDIKEQIEEIGKSVSTTIKGTPLYELLLRATSPLFEVFVEVKKGDEEMQSRRVVEFFVPSSMFEGYKQVYILAANFKQTELYHLMTDINNFNLDTQWTLHNITDELDKDRIKQAEERYKRIHLYPLNNNPEMKFLSIANLTGCFVAPTDNIQKVCREIHRFGFTDRIGYKNLYKTLVSDKEEHEIQKVLDEFGVRKSLLNHYCMEAQAILDELGFQDSYLYTTNSGKYFNIVNSLLSGDKINISVKSHGQNMYMNHNVIVFLAALNPTPDLIDFYSYRLPHYKPNIDWAIEDIYQTLMRTCARDLNSDKAVHIILPSLWMADTLNREKLGNMAVVHPSRSSYGTVSKGSYSRTPEEKKRDDKLAAKRYASEELNKKINSLTTSITNQKRRLDKLIAFGGRENMKHKMTEEILRKEAELEVLKEKRKTERVRYSCRML